MIPKGLFTQIAIILLSVGIIIAYIQPTFESIADKQDSIGIYQNEKDKVSQVNQKLAAQISSLESIATTDTRDLLVYMPSQVDEIAVMRDLQAISDEAGVLFRTVVYDGPQEDEDEENLIGPYPHDFSLNFEAVYSSTKEFFTLLQQNKYPLEVSSLEINSGEGGFLEVAVIITTYSHKPPEINLLDI